MVWGVEADRLVIRDSAFEERESASWRMDLNRERLEAREERAKVSGWRTSEMVSRVVLCMKLVVWTGLVGEMMGACSNWR